MQNFFSEILITSSLCHLFLLKYLTEEIHQDHSASHFLMIYIRHICAAQNQ